MKISGLVGRNPEDLQTLNAAKNFIYKEWTKQGYKITEQKYTVKNLLNEEVEVANLIVSYNSDETKEKKTVVVGAHYDVYDKLPGADDNASGVAGLLELTRLVMQEKPKINHRLEFVAYTLEEPPHYDTKDMGSYIHAKSMKEAGRDISLMISLEMIGYFSDEVGSQNYPIPLLNKIYSDRGNFITIVGAFKELFVSRKANTYFQMMTDLPVFSINTTRYMEGIDWSDHRSYWDFGYPALMITDTSFLRNKHYHQATDTFDKLDYERMAKVVLGTYGIITNF